MALERNRSKPTLNRLPPDATHPALLTHPLSLEGVSLTNHLRRQNSQSTASDENASIYHCSPLTCQQPTGRATPPRLREFLKAGFPQPIQPIQPQ